MQFKPFYIHKQIIKPKHGQKRGFTAYIQPSDKPRTIIVQVTFCARGDEFCKKLGREYVQMEYKHEVNPRDLPEIIAAACDTMYNLKAGSHSPRVFYYFWKYLF